MVRQLLYRHPVRRVLLQRLVQKVTSLPRHKHIRRDTYLLLYYLYQLLFSVYLERVLPHQHLVHHYTQRPDIDLLIVLVSFQNLRTDIEGSPTEGCPHLVIQMHRPPEIAQFNDPFMHDNVFRFDVPMDNAMAM